jgi:glutathione synthase
MSKKQILVRKLGIVTNPSELDDQDTFFLFVNEAIKRAGLDVYVFDANDVSSNNVVQTKLIKGPIYLESKGQLDTKTTVMNLSDFDLIFLKKNPPMDKDCSKLLEKLSKEKIPTVNHPRGIVKMGSKAYLKHFPQITPNTLFATTVQDALKFIKKIGNCVIKQSDSYGGKGVKHIQFKYNKFYEFKKNKRVSLSELAVSKIIKKYLDLSQDKILLIVEYYVSAPKRGDKRIVILEGDILGSYIRVPDAESGICGCNNGSRFYDPTQRDYDIVKILRPYLKKNGIQLAGLDLLVSKKGIEHLSEINVVNPGFYNLDVVNPGLNIAKKIVDMLYANMA